MQLDESYDHHDSTQLTGERERARKKVEKERVVQQLESDQVMQSPFDRPNLPLQKSQNLHTIELN